MQYLDNISLKHRMQPKQSNYSRLQSNLVTSLAFSLSGEFCCVAIKREVKLLIFRVRDIANVDSWELLQEMHEQTQPISQVDWAKDDKIISGSHDRSVFIYKKTSNASWQKTLVNIDIKLSVLCAKWAPSSKKFAVSGSCTTLAVGFYNIETSCWTTSNRTRLFKSPIISLSFHPSSKVVAAGSIDKSIKLISCSFQNSDNPFARKSDTEDGSYQGPFHNVNSMFEVLVSIDNAGGWVNHLSFELNGSFLLVLPHGNHCKLFEVSDSGKGSQMKETDIKWHGLPFLAGYISDKGVLYAGGYDNKVAVFNRSSSGFSFSHFLERNQKSSESTISKGIVSKIKSSMQKQGNLLTVEALQPWQSSNPIKVLPSPNKKFVVSYDINGNVHFWQ